ncbi:MAG: hypothetical protein C0482_21945 [Gordonia sp.]|nr:hypothetical protein [Gordonia sp. (in: high G+C Gram-positive bacteria)]
MGYVRGIVRRVTVEVEYPDGTRKISDVAEPERLAWIAFHTDGLREVDRAGYDVSETDSTVNPTMALYRDDSTMAWGCTQKEC